MKHFPKDYYLSRVGSLCLIVYKRPATQLQARNGSIHKTRENVNDANLCNYVDIGPIVVNVKLFLIDKCSGLDYVLCLNVLDANCLQNQYG